MNSGPVQLTAEDVEDCVVAYQSGGSYAWARLKRLHPDTPDEWLRSFYGEPGPQDVYTVRPSEFHSVGPDVYLTVEVSVLGPDEEEFEIYSDQLAAPIVQYRTGTREITAELPMTAVYQSPILRAWLEESGTQISIL